ncbi:hypothetical protein BC826DRAFT_1104304 [Russula brevipes]|nr:hypothetical protein BC826DRAFT_1104304 [Russula brevipes]
MSNYSFSPAYLAGSVTGAVAFETVTLGPYQVSPQLFGASHIHLMVTCLLTLAEHHSLLDDSRRFKFFVHLGRDRVTFRTHRTYPLAFGQLDPSLTDHPGNFAFTRVHEGFQPASKPVSTQFSSNGSSVFAGFASSRVPVLPLPSPSLIPVQHPS